MRGWGGPGSGITVVVQIAIPLATESVGIGALLVAKAHVPIPVVVVPSVTVIRGQTTIALRGYTSHRQYVQEEETQTLQRVTTPLLTSESTISSVPGGWGIVTVVGVAPSTSGLTRIVSVRVAPSSVGVRIEAISAARVIPVGVNGPLVGIVATWTELSWRGRKGGGGRDTSWLS